MAPALLLRQALHTQIAKHHIQQATKNAFSIGEILHSYTQPHESAARPLQRFAHHIKGMCLLIGSSCCHGKFLESQLILTLPSWSHDLINFISQNQANLIQGCPSLMFS